MSVLEVLIENIYKIIAGFVVLVAYVVRLEAAMKRNTERHDELEKKFTQIESRAEISRTQMKSDLSSFRTEMNTNLASINATMKEIMFRLGDKSDK